MGRGHKILQLRKMSCLYILCDTLLVNIINVIFEDDNPFYFHSLGGSCCQNYEMLILCP